MLSNGIIVSIQGYSVATTQELAEKAQDAGAVAIRTDCQIDVDIDIIGLFKYNPKKRKHYITTSKPSIEKVSLQSDYVAIDSRVGQDNMQKLYDYCKAMNILIVADVGCIEDVNNLLTVGLPDYIATTFSFQHNKGNPDIQLIKDIVKKTNIPVIAEGGFEHQYQIQEAVNAGAHAVCIGKAISKIYELTESYVNYYNAFWRKTCC
jgi:N-acylglucosamine-6-phosphate 2-epimerase